MNYQQPLHTLYNLFDLLYGKNHVLDEEKSLEHVERSLAKFGEAGLTRFGRWREIFR